MTRIFAAIALFAVSACTAMPPGQTSPASTAAAPQASAAGGMTEPQARMQLMSNGYANLSSLRKDNGGLWRGNGVKGGQTVNVAVDPQGKITSP